MRRRALLTTLPALALPGLAQAQQGVVFPPGSAIGLRPPAGMKPAARFTGFVDEANQASILLAELPPETYAGLAALDDAAFLQRQGIAVAARREATLPVGRAVLLRGTQRAASGTVGKHILILGAPAITALATFQYPEGSKAHTASTAEAALLSAAIRPVPPLAEKIAALPFALRDMAGFRPIRTLAGTGLILTDGPLDVAPDAEQPLVVVQRQFSPDGGAASRAALARSRFAAAGLGTPTVLRDEAMGASGWLLDATGPDARTSAPRYAYQVVRLVPGGVLHLLAIARPDGRDALARRLGRVAAGMEPR